MQNYNKAIYIRGVLNMSGQRGNKRSTHRKVASKQNESQQSNGVLSNKKPNFLKSITKSNTFISIVSSIVSSIVICVGGFIITNHINSKVAPYIMQADFLNLQHELEKSINEQFKTLNSELNTKIDGEMDGLSSRITTIETALMISSKYKHNLLKPIEEGTIKTKHVSVEMDSILSQPTWKSDDIIFQDAKSDIKYLAKDLVDQKILVKYRTGNQENFFYGKYNKSNQWDGDCIINVYENNNLKLIMEAKYDNGQLLNYRQINKFTTKAGINVWNISSRTAMDNYTCGENWYYFRGSSEHVKSFESNEVTVEDIISIDEFQNNIKDDSWLEGYYKGNTYDGHFNDNTNNAFMIKFFEDGTIRTLYVGNFENGDFNDETGNAWYITKDVNTAYMYYTGYFKDGKTENNIGSEFENPVSLKEIDSKLLEHQFYLKVINSDITLNWSKPNTVEQDN